MDRPHKLMKAGAGSLGVQPPSDGVREHPIMSGSTGTTGMLTAENPIFPVKTQGGNAALSQELQNMGLQHEPTKGSYGAPENSFIVYGASRQQMFDLGHRYGQESVVHSEGGHPNHELMYTNGDNIGRSHKSLQDFDYFPKEPPPDYYTELPSTKGYLRLKFDFDNMHDTPMRPLVTAMPSHVPTPGEPPTQKSEVRSLIDSILRKSIGGRDHPNAYAWHDSHTTHHFTVKGTGGVLVRTAPHLQKADGEHPHMDGPKNIPPPPPKPGEPGHGNDQAAGVGVDTYAKYAAPFGAIDKSQKSDLFHYPLHGKLPDIQRLVKDHGFTVFYAGGKFGRPDLATRNYNTKHLMIYDPTPESGGDFGDRDYTDAWRQSHELAHALTYPDVNRIYGEGRRLGKLGVHRTQNEATRAVHWEWMVAQKQRELLGKVGVHVPDDVFHRELNTVMHDAVHRAVTGKFTEPAAEGFRPHSHKIPLETSLGLVRDAAHNLGLMGSHDLLTKSERSTDVSQQPKTHTIPEVKERLAKAIKERVAAFEGEMLQLRQRELRKSDGCIVCTQPAASCTCFSRLEKAYSSKDNMNAGNFAPGAKHPPKTVTYREGEEPHHIPGKLNDARHAAVKRKGAEPTEKCGEMTPGKKLGKDEMCADCGKKECCCEGVLPDDKKSKDQSPDESGSGGDITKGKKLGKGAPPMAAPPSAKAGSPKLPAGPKSPMAKADPPSTGTTSVNAPVRSDSISPAVHTTNIGPSMASQPAKTFAGPSPTGSDTITGGPSTGASAAPSGIGGRGGKVDTGPASVPRGGRGGKVMGKSDSIPGRRLAKALPRLGGKDPASQMMTQHAAASAPVANAAPAAAPAPKLGAADQAARHAQYADFTPAGAFPAPAGAAAGAMKPGPVTPPAGMAGVKPPSSAVATPPGGRLQRFTDALHGKKAPAPLAMSEMRKSLGSCLLCAKPEHSGECE